MTRETKIGLLVGLMFIIVIGVLLSDHLTSATEPTMANQAGIGEKAFSSLSTPGTPNKHIAEVKVEDIVPPAPVPTPTETVTKPADPGNVSVTVTGPGGAAPADPLDVTSRAMQGHSPFPDSGASTLTLGGTPAPNNVPVPPAPAVSPAPAANPPAAPVQPAPREYKAVAGDTISKMASRFYGKNTEQTRNLIINANPSLKAAPDRIVVGRAYIIPVVAQPAVATATSGSSTTRPVSLAAVPATAAPRIYVVREKDNLWKIATEQCHDSRAVDAIVKLNSGVIKSKTQQLQVGMKLRLPEK